MPESTQKQLTTVRPPRVKITYDVELGDAIEQKELPLVVGIMADLSGKPAKALGPLKERKFVEVDRDNFNVVMDTIRPRLELKFLKDDGTSDGTPDVTLEFKHLDDFDPVAIARRDPGLKALFEARERLSDLATKLDGNDALEDQLRAVQGETVDLDTIRGLLAPVANGKDAKGPADTADPANPADVTDTPADGTDTPATA